MNRRERNLMRNDPEKNDQELWHALTKDNEEAISTLFVRYYPQLFSYAFKIVQKRSLVEDTIQDIFLSLWKNRKRHADVKSVKAYLFKSVRWKIIRARLSENSRVARNHKYTEELSDFVLSHEEFLINEELRREQQAALKSAVAGLSKRQQEALYLRFYHGLKYEEIAQVMEIANQTARNYIFEALQTLRKQLSILLPLA